MSVPQCVSPGNFNSTNNPLLPAIKNACIIGGAIDISDAALKAAHQDCCSGDNSGVVRENSCYLVCEVNQVYALQKYPKCMADKFKTTPAPMGVKEQCFGTLVEDSQASVITLTGTHIATDGNIGSATCSVAMGTAPSETTISLSPTSSLTVSSVIVDGTPKPTASGNSSIPTSGFNSSSTGSASPSATSPSKASRGSISTGTVFIVGLAFLGLIV